MAKKERINYSTGNPWESLRGFSRAVKVGATLYISATSAINSRGEVAGIGDAYEQTKWILNRIRQIATESGFDHRDIVRTHLYVTDISRWNDYARAHREFFDKIRPASAIVEVARLTDPRFLVEIEAEAIQGYQDKEFEKLTTLDD